MARITIEELIGLIDCKTDLKAIKIYNAGKSGNNPECQIDLDFDYTLPKKLKDEIVLWFDFRRSSNMMEIYF